MAGRRRRGSFAATTSAPTSRGRGRSHEKNAGGFAEAVDSWRLFPRNEFIEIEKDARHRRPGGELFGVDLLGQPGWHEQRSVVRRRCEAGPLLGNQVGKTLLLHRAGQTGQAELESTAKPFGIVILRLSQDTACQSLGELKKGLVVEQS